MEKIKCLGSNTIPRNTHPRTPPHHLREPVPPPKKASKPHSKPDPKRKVDIYV